MRLTKIAQAPRHQRDNRNRRQRFAFRVIPQGQQFRVNRRQIVIKLSKATIHCRNRHDHQCRCHEQALHQVRPRDR
ncbi:Uncharacterised protein [Vibrio cholerae]|nr:Uncharacterised protein [Vibrio cholerae]